MIVFVRHPSMVETVPIHPRATRWLQPSRVRVLLGWIRALIRAIRRRRAVSATTLTVGVDIASLFEPLTGIGWYLRQLLWELRDRPDLKLRLYGPELVELPGGMVPRVELPQGCAIEWVRFPAAPADAFAGQRLTGWLPRLAPLWVAADANDVLFAPNFIAPPHFRWSRGALVTTVHDLTFEKLPGLVRPDTAAAFKERLERTFLDSARLITVSESVRNEILSSHHFPPSRISAIHHGPGQATVASDRHLPDGVPARFGLFVGTLEPRKNLPTLIRAWRQLRKRHPAPTLLLCGQYGWNTREIRDEVVQASSEGWLRQLGYLSVEELAALYCNASVVALPSLYEGFGLPALEAMAFGTPLVASDIPVLHEVAGDAALYAPPQDVSAWADQLERVLTNPALARDLASRGRARARRFSWERSAAEHLEVWRKAAGTT